MPPEMFESAMALDPPRKSHGFRMSGGRLPAVYRLL